MDCRSLRTELAPFSSSYERMSNNQGVIGFGGFGCVEQCVLPLLRIAYWPSSRR